MKVLAAHKTPRAAHRKACATLAGVSVVLAVPGTPVAVAEARKTVMETQPKVEEKYPGEFNMMRGDSIKRFDKKRYLGQWYEVASLKTGFAGQGQEDCHCTQGIYGMDDTTGEIQVDTFCVHGGPGGKISGIQGKVTCLSDEGRDKYATPVELMEKIESKCKLRFPSIPFIPGEPYDVISTDYETFALVKGSSGKGFVQVYSRTPNPGREFIEKYKDYLSTVGYNRDEIVDTPQDCPVVGKEKMLAIMDGPGAGSEQARAMFTNTMEAPKSLFSKEEGKEALKSGVAFNKVNPLNIAKDFGKLLLGE